MGNASSFGDGEKIKQIHQQKALPNLILEGLFCGPDSPTMFGVAEFKIT
jgi:hypothetical protein